MRAWPGSDVAGGAAVELDQAVACLGGSVVRAVGVPVSQERGARAGQGLVESFYPRDRAGPEDLDDMLGRRSPGCEVVGRDCSPMGLRLQ